MSAPAAGAGVEAGSGATSGSGSGSGAGTVGPGVRAAVGAGRSLWRAVGPDVEGADDLRALAMWPRTVAMATAGVVSPLLLPVALVWALLALLL